MIDLEGLDDVERVVIDAIIEGAQSSDPNIHPDLNSPSHPITKTKPGNTEGSPSGESWVEKIKKKIAEISKRDPDIYPLF